MKSALCCFLLATAGLCAQSTDKLNSDLMALSSPIVSRSAVAQQVTDDILELADKDAQPTRKSVSDFADELVQTLFARRVTAENIKPLTEALLQVLHSSGASSSAFHRAVSSFRIALFRFDQSSTHAKNAVDRLFVLGQEIHGPEDLPVDLPRRSK
jgi:hypothetical protein